MHIAVWPMPTTQMRRDDSVTDGSAVTEAYRGTDDVTEPVTHTEPQPGADEPADS